ncbi:hypothetical protein RJ641_020215 [Dillenia turbinata]|uniref:Uncharacterized protein n=1 Tax=Dillenia turbinata TaxID=194707 RepID=A0AAN8UE65_9MAGN
MVKDGFLLFFHRRVLACVALKPCGGSRKTHFGTAFPATGEKESMVSASIPSSSRTKSVIFPCNIDDKTYTEKIYKPHEPEISLDKSFFELEILLSQVSFSSSSSTLLPATQKQVCFWNIFRLLRYAADSDGKNVILTGIARADIRMTIIMATNVKEKAVLKETRSDNTVIARRYMPRQTLAACVKRKWLGSEESSQMQEYKSEQNTTGQNI